MSLQSALILSAVAMLATSAVAKTGSTIYTPERVANARRNIERYDWAKEIRDKAVAAANVYARQTDDFLWALIPPNEIPRSIEVNVDRGCPRCGRQIDRFGNYPWKCDVIARPWKIECPSCGEVFPKNDFAGFYESGKDDRGVFRPERADRALLFNSDHPDPSDPLHNYGVDDGLGWKDENGDVFRFIGYYGHYGAWAAILSALRNFRDAYVYTGDAVYAHKAGLMLYRVAEFYPSMDWNTCHKLGFSNSDGGSGLGKIYGRIWETGVASTLTSAYDAVYPGLDDPKLLEYLSAKAGKRVDARALRAHIETNIVREVHDGILRRQIAGNEGMHQYAMAQAAIVLDEPGTSDRWLKWLFAPGDLHAGDVGGGNIPGIFETKVDDDGMGNEASPSYNAIWRGRFREIDEVLANYPRYKGPRMTDFPKYRRMFEAPVRLICLDKFVPNIGDAGKTGSPGTGNISVDDLVYAYRTFKDPRFAQMAHYINHGTCDGIRGGIFDAEPESIAGEIAAAVAEHGPYVPRTDHMPAYGLAILRSGSGRNSRALTLYYGRNRGHGHKDTLNIELFGHGLNLMPDLGYPELATATCASRHVWTNNTISHNTVVVDRAKQANSHSGVSRFVVQGEGACAAEVYAEQVYPQTSLYQRTAAMVDITEEDFYVVDIFRVRGGKEHHYSLHGPEGEVETDGLRLAAQRGGTLAGDDIPFQADLGAREPWSKASGFQYLYDVRRDASPRRSCAVTWTVKDTWKVLDEPKDIRLRINLLSPPGEVVLAHGDPPQNKPGNPRRLTYIVCPNECPDSTFVSVIEPYSGDRSIRSIEREDRGDTVIVTVRLASGRTDYIVSSTEPRRTVLGAHEFEGRFGILSERGGKVNVALAVE